MTKDRRKIRHQNKVNQRHSEDKGNDKEKSPADSEKKTGGADSSETVTKDDVAGASGSAPKQQRERLRDRRRVGEVQQPDKSEEDEKKPEGSKPEIGEEKKVETASERRYAKRQIFSNWEQYDLPLRIDDKDDDESIGAADFSELLNAPISEGGHFRFKTERTWDEDRTAFCSEFFSLDLQQLANGLLSIPFNKRIGLPLEYFREEEIQKMEAESKRYLENQSLTQTNAENQSLTQTNAENQSITQAIARHVLDILTEPKGDQMYFENDEEKDGTNDEQVEAVWALTDDPALDDTPDEFAETGVTTKSTSKDEVVNKEHAIKDDLSFDFKDELKKSREGTPARVTQSDNKISREVTPVRTEVKKEVPLDVLPSAVISDSKKLKDGDDDLDFLLTLKAPVAETREPVLNNLVTNSEVEKDLLDEHNEEGKSGAICLPSANTTDKTQSLEDWLDTILDD